MAKKYSIDTSAILDCWRRYYPPDIFPGVWQVVEDLFTQEIIIASEEIYYELEKKDDEVFSWIKSKKHLLIDSSDPNIQKRVTEILKENKKLIDTRKNRSGADPYVIAVAIENQCAVITTESLSQNPEKKPNIPNVCESCDIRWMNMINFLREQGCNFR